MASYEAQSNLEAEKSVLGCMMLDAECLKRLDRLSDDDFFHRGHIHIARAMRAIKARGVPVDLITLTDELYNRGEAEAVGGVLYLTELSRYVPTTANIDAYIRIVKDEARKRFIRRQCARIDRMVCDGDELPAIIGECEDWLRQMRGSIDVADESMASIAMRVFAQLEERAQGKGLGTLTGLGELDTLTGGIWDGEVTVVAGRPGTGKSAFALCVARAFATEGKAVQIFSREMPDVDVTRRAMSAESGVNHSRLRNGDLTDDDWCAAADGMSKIHNYRAPIWIDERSLTPSALRAKCRYRADTEGLGLIVIDYLQLLGSDGRHGNNNERISAISWEIKTMAQDLKTPVLLLSQFSREIERRGGKPQLSDLRDSGAIEQDANNIVALWTPENDVDTMLLSYLAADGKKLVRLELLKQRNGPVGHADVVFDAPHMDFEPLPDFFEHRQGRCDR